MLLVDLRNCHKQKGESHQRGEQEHPGKQKRWFIGSPTEARREWIAEAGGRKGKPSSKGEVMVEREGGREVDRCFKEKNVERIQGEKDAPHGRVSSHCD